MAFPIDKTCIDKSLPVPVGVQLRGLLAYVISHGDMPYGARLPSVRDLASELGLATMTVNQVYKQLRTAGLVDIRPGLGAFVARDPARVLGAAPRIAALRNRIDGLLDAASELGIASDDLVALINAQTRVRRLRTGLRIIFVGVFEEPARAYVAEIKPYLAATDDIDVTTLDKLRRDGAERVRCARADFLITFVHRETELRAVAPDADLVTIRFIPSESTRRALAGIDPRSRLVAVTAFKEYIAIMRPSIQRFAPHVSDIVITYLGAPDLARTLRNCDVVVYATGADAVKTMLDADVQAFEYRHAPDHGEIERILTPYLSERRSRKAETAAGEGASAQRILPFRKSAALSGRRKNPTFSTTKGERT